MSSLLLAINAYRGFLANPAAVLRLAAKSLLLAIAGLLIYFLGSAIFLNLGSTLPEPLLSLVSTSMRYCVVWVTATPVLVGWSIRVSGIDGAVPRKALILEIAVIWLTVPVLIGIADVLVSIIAASCVGVGAATWTTFPDALDIAIGCSELASPHDPLPRGLITAGAFALVVPWLAAIPLIVSDAPFPYGAARASLRNCRGLFTGNLITALLPIYLIILIVERSGLSMLALPIDAIGSGFVVAGIAAALHKQTAIAAEPSQS
jgi:hypothetical protein